MTTWAWGGMERSIRRRSPLRRVVNRHYYTNKYCRPGEGSIMHSLECEHDIFTKKSYGEPQRMRCRECAMKAPAEERG